MNPFNDVPISYNKKQNKRTLYNWPLHEYRFCMRECILICHKIRDEGNKIRDEGTHLILEW